ncbi:hypothetical protein U1Q18_009204 [Sarracenia purpurea var. burkii]
METTMAVRSSGPLLFPPKVVIKIGDDPSYATVVDRTISNPSSSGGAMELSSKGEDKSSVAQAPEIRRLEKCHSSDKSVAGGGVIVGGLTTAIFVAVYCHIRVTRRRDDDEKH